MAKLLDSARYQDSFISYQPLPANYAFIREHGLEEFVRREMEKQIFLRFLIDNYDEGRSKGFYCTSCQLVPVDTLKEAVAEAETKMREDTLIRDKAKTIKAAVNSIAEILEIDLRLRK